MRLACLSDLHLGFRAYTAAEGGRNVREMDVEKAFATAIDQIIEYRPHIVTIAGDVFHSPAVSDYAKLAFLLGVRRLLEAGFIVIIEQGNHDAGKTANVLTPLMLATALAGRLHVVTTPKRIDVTVWQDAVTSQKVSVACFPYVARGNGEKYVLEPNPDADLNILVMHAAVAGDQDGNLPWFYSGGESVDVTREAEKWDIIHLGDFHEYRLFNCPGRVFYSGSIERTSSDIWKEHSGKGWVSVDTEKLGHVGVDFHEIPTRPMEDLTFPEDLLDVQSAAAAVNGFLTELTWVDAVEPHPDEGAVGVEDAIMRLVVPDFPRDQRDQIDWKLVEQIKQRALYFDLDLRYKKVETVDLGGTETSKSASIEDALRALCGDDAELLRLIMDYVAPTQEIERALEEAVA